ncbi:MAG: hypothetical protein PHI37_05585, partial [Candidatus Gracilibacteria bacterium]|nr:hypothetical protein [Candidatus Gracilibacteria bacterium]
ACGNTAWNSWNTVNDGAAPCTFTNTTPTFYSKLNHGPLGDYNALNGVGRIISSTSTNRILIGGGSWTYTAYAGIFSLNLNLDSTYAHTHIGFRCAYSVN